MLIDRWHEVVAKGNHRSSPAATELMGAYRRLAQRFQFSDEASAMAAHLAADYPDLLIRNYQFAVPPYPTTYIQYNSRAWVKAFGADKYDSSLDRMDFNIGHLIHNGCVVTLIDDAVDGKFVGVCPWMWSLGEQAHVAQARLAQRHKMRMIRWDVQGSKFKDEHITMASMILGTTLHHPRAHLTDEIISDMFQRVRLWVEHTVDKAGAVDLLKSFTGEMRTLWQLLLFINQPQHVQFDSVAARRQLVGNKSVAFPSYRVVRIKPKTTVHHVVRTIRERMKPGLHDVREFWRNFDKNDNCEHEWPLLPNEEGQFHCQRCPQWRVRVSGHQRGDPSRPVVRKGYKV